MKALASSRPWLVGILIVAVNFPLFGQSPALKAPASFPYDWSHRHLIFSNPRTARDLQRVERDVRYWQQQQRRGSGGQSPHPFLPAPPEPRKQTGAANLLKRDWSMSLGPGAKVAAGMFPAKYSFDTSTANCGSAATPDYVVFPTGLASTNAQAGIAAFDNLYSGCTGTVPSTYWAYETSGTGDNCTTCVIVTSPSLSGDGSQIAFVGSSAGGSFLYVLKPKSGEGTVGAPATPSTATTSPAAYAACRNQSGPSAPSCLLSLPLGANSSTNSSPFYDFNADTIYVGDDNGVLYKYTGVFTTTPTRVVDSFFPGTVDPGAILTSPIYEINSSNIYIADSNGLLSYVREWNSTMGTCDSGTPPCLGDTTINAGARNPIVSAPLLDVTNQEIYVFVSNDGNGNSGVFQAPMDFSSSIEATVGAEFANTLYAGAFDNAYYNAAGSGHLYVCGNVSSSLGLEQNLALYRIGFNDAGVMNSSADATSVSLTSAVVVAETTPPSCSPGTEISPDSNSDLFFVSVTNDASSSSCSGTGCIMNFAVAAWQPDTAYALGDKVLDSNFEVEVVTVPGTSGSSTPAWSTTGGDPTNDGGVTWRNGAALTAGSPSAWGMLTLYDASSEILDSNGNVEVETTNPAGLSGLTQPAWSTTIGATQTDGTAHWINLGPPASFALTETDGTSGVIVDNTVPSTTLAGASEVYFTPLGTGNCGSGDGCAVQASQAGLQ